jgi:glycosyltransferase involved in cell wall biosynthesis
MHFALVSDTFYPDKNSASVHLLDLTRHLVFTGHRVTVFVPESLQENSWTVNWIDGVRVIRIKSYRIRDTGYVARALAELIMPFLMIFRYFQNALVNEKWDGVLWYSPSIFHGPFISFLKKRSTCKTYLIIRDIFPEWALDIGLMSRGLPFHFFSAVAKYQYSVADVIGVQTEGNCTYFENWKRKAGRRLEVLPSWYAKSIVVPCSIRLSETILADRKVFVYAGNMGIAQGMEILLSLAVSMRHRTDVGFLFVGRGSYMTQLKKIVKQEQLDSVLFFDEIRSDEIPDLFAQCAVGLVALDHRHKTHNIPGKFISYMQNGLPVLANVNAGNDLAQMIRHEQVGQVCENNDLQTLKRIAQNLLEQVDSDANLPMRCKALFEKKFSVESAVKQIVKAMSD